MSDRNPVILWRVIAVCFVLCLAFWIWLAVALLSPVRADVIRNDGGGDVREYTLRANLAVLKGKTIVIDGWCASACVMYLRAGCVTPRARLGFHSPYGGTKAARQAARETLADHMPKAMGAWYLAGSARHSAAVVLTAGQAVAMGARACAGWWK